MLSNLLVLAIAVLAHGSPVDKEIRMTQETVDEINSMNLGFEVEI
jgi:hypothetical protein